MFSIAPHGVPLSELLGGLEFKTISLSGEELLELAASIVTALASIHERMPTLAHGALTPAHIVLQRWIHRAHWRRIRRCAASLAAQP